MLVYFLGLLLLASTLFIANYNINRHVVFRFYQRLVCFNCINCSPSLVSETNFWWTGNPFFAIVEFCKFIFIDRQIMFYEIQCITDAINVTSPTIIKHCLSDFFLFYLLLTKAIVPFNHATSYIQSKAVHSQ